MKKLLIISLFILGCVGKQGPLGVTGYSLVYKILSAPNGSCGYNPDGSAVAGTILMIAQDTTRSGAWNQNDLDQESILTCNGVNGSDGTNGTDGTNETQVTIVQFCPNTTSYPNTFSEIGLCINGNLYAVYSANGGFLSYLPEGYYSSEGINSSCNFTVIANCGVNN